MHSFDSFRYIALSLDTLSAVPHLCVDQSSTVPGASRCNILPTDTLHLFLQPECCAGSETALLEYPDPRICGEADRKRGVKMQMPMPTESSIIISASVTEAAKNIILHYFILSRLYSATTSTSAKIDHGARRSEKEGASHTEKVHPGPPSART